LLPLITSINFARELAHKGENLTHALKDLSALFHQVSIAQILNTSEVSDDIKALSSNQDLQLFYHIVINGSKELPLAPSEEIGFEMTLLRMLSFFKCFGYLFPLLLRVDI
jgi:DNA polymerase-3 subunit gamma/tau